MEHNQYLNEIKYLVQRNFGQSHINTNDLTNIVINIDSTTSKPYDSTTTPNGNTLLGITQRISIEKAKKYQENFKRYFSDHLQLRKEFKIEYSSLKETIENHKNVVLRLIDIGGSFEIAQLIGNNAFLISQDGRELTEAEYKNGKISFDLGFGKNLDDNLKYISNNLKKDNTRNITIFHYGNFDELPDEIPHENITIIFKPAIIDDYFDANHFQFTFVMEIFDNKNKSALVETSYYDTFQLCPPNC